MVSTGGVATAALRGIIDQDARMRDVAGPSKAPGSRMKAASKPTKKVGHRARAADPFKTAGGAVDLNSRMKLASRIGSGTSINIRGASTRPALLRTSKIASGGTMRIPNRGNTLDGWREFVQSRYNAEVGFLNLERMVDDEVLKKHKLSPPTVPGANRKEMPVVFKLASQLKPPVKTISLANNNIRTGLLLQTLPHYLPDLRNLSLQGNAIGTWKDVDYIAGRKDKERLSNLREIIFLDNPLRESELKAGRAENYKSEMGRRFPSLEVLDQESIAKISFDVPVASSSKGSTSNIPSATSFPLQMAPPFVTGVDGALISNFLFRFFPLFDNQSAALKNAYAPNAIFSYSALTSIPARARVRGFHHSKEMPNQTKLAWSPWLKNEAGGSRNLRRMGGGLDRIVRLLHTGPDEIIKATLALPQTTHDVAGAAEKFCIDAWPIGQDSAMQLFLCVHGEFAEAPSQGIRSFDRSFILAPAPDGSTAKADGWDVVILSDQLTVRAYSSHQSWAPGPLKVQEGETATTKETRPTQAVRLAEASSVPIPDAIQAEVQSIPEPQRSLVVTVCGRTGLNVKFAVDCLTQNEWDVEKAVANFEQVKANLGRDAFL